MGAIRKNLTNSKFKPLKNIDMERVYEEIDSGKTITEIAKELGVCRQTLYTHHNRYQASLKKI